MYTLYWIPLTGFPTHPLQHLCKLSSAVAAFGGGQLVPLTPDPPLLLFFWSELRQHMRKVNRQVVMEGKRKR